MWKGTEEILSDERAQSKKNKITSHVNVCGTDVRVPVSLPAVRYLQKDASPQKQMLCWSIAADVYQTHPALVFIAVASVITTTIIYSLYIRFPPRMSRSMAVHRMTPLWRGMTSPARDHVNLVACHVPRDTYFMAFQGHETCMLAAKVKFNKVSA